MVLGLNYPNGPLTFGEVLGPRNILRILDFADLFLRRSALSCDPVAPPPRVARPVPIRERNLKAKRHVGCLYLRRKANPVRPTVQLAGQVRPDDLLAGVIKKVVEGNPIDAAAINDVYVGSGDQGGEDARCVARHALLLAGLPKSVPGMVFQRNCASGLSAAISSAAQAITVGEADMIIAGGVESMSRAPFVVEQSEAPYAREFKVFNSTIGDRFPNPKIHKQFGANSMPETANNLASDFQITREQADVFALGLADEVQGGQGGRLLRGRSLDPGSTPRPQGRRRDGRRGRASAPRDDDGDPGQAARPVRRRRDPAGDASGVNDGAVAMIIGSKALGEKTGMKPIARILSSGSAGVPPRIMGYGPSPPASEKALARAGLTRQDMDVIEINEAFATEVLACLKGMNIAFDDSRVNINGGAMPRHPLGASGPRIALTAARQLQRTGGKYGLVTLCVGIGQGAVMVIERCD